MAWSCLLNEVEILADGICRASVPIATGSLLGRHYFQKVPKLPGKYVPAGFQVIGEGLGFVLGQNYDLV